MNSSRGRAALLGFAVFWLSLVPVGSVAQQVPVADATTTTVRDACRSQFRYLKPALHAMDLKRPPVVTDGVTSNIAEAEWPFMAVAYYGYACANLAQCDVTLRADALTEMRWALDALQLPSLSGFMTRHFGEPFGKGSLTPAVFVHGHFLSLAVRYREVTGDRRYDEIMGRVAAALGDGFARSDQGLLLSYKAPVMWWLTDNFTAFSALVRYDRIFKTQFSASGDKLIASIKKHYLDPKTGMYATYVDAPSRTVRQGPRGISMMYGLHFLKDFAPEFAAGQYALAKRYLVAPVFLGCCAVREYPLGQQGPADIDSGQLVMGFGPSASGFGIAASAVMGDGATTRQLLLALSLLGLEVVDGDKLSYRDVPQVGQVVILFGRSELLRLAAAEGSGTPGAK